MNERSFDFGETRLEGVTAFFFWLFLRMTYDVPCRGIDKKTVLV